MNPKAKIRAGPTRPKSGSDGKRIVQWIASAHVEADMTLQVLYCDNHLLVVFKPSGMLSQSDITGDADVLTLGKAYLKNRFDKTGNVFLGLVHRLDRPASGIMILGRTSKAAARLTQQFKNHRPIKRYWAIVIGDPGRGETWEDHMVKDERTARIVPATHAKAKSARLTWKTLGREQGCSLVDVELHTGRPHQIRLQFASRGFPLLGDVRYGATKEFDGRNLALHCHTLEVDHPTRKTPMRWTAPPPDSWGDWFINMRTRLIQRR